MKTPHEMAQELMKMPTASTPPTQECVGYRLTYKSGKTQLIDRVPDSFEIRECKIEPVRAALEETK